MNETPMDRFEQRVRTAAGTFAYPSTPDIAGAVGERLRARQTERARRWQPRWAIAAVIVVVLLAGLMAVPQVRAGVLEIIRIGVVRIFPQGLEGVPAPTQTPVEPAPGDAVRGHRIYLASTASEARPTRALHSFEVTDAGVSRVAQFPLGPGDTGEVRVAEDGRTAAVAGVDRTQQHVQLFDLVHMRAGPRLPVEGASVATVGRLEVIPVGDNVHVLWPGIERWEIYDRAALLGPTPKGAATLNQAQLHAVRFVDPEAIHGRLVAVSPATQTLYRLGEHLVAVDMTDGQVTGRLRLAGMTDTIRAADDRTTTPVALSPDGTRLYVIQTDTLLVVDTETLEIEHTVEGMSTDDQLTATTSPDGRRLYLSGRHGSAGVQVIDTQTFAVRGRVVPDTPVLDVALSPDGRRLYLLSPEELITVDVETRDVIARRPVSVDPRTAALVTGSIPEVPPPTPVPSPTPLPSILDLAGETTLAEARKTVEFPIRLPAYPPDLGPPDTVFVQQMEGAAVVLVWLEPGRRGEVRMSLHMLTSGMMVGKGGPTIVRETTVNGQRALWTEGPYLLRVQGGDYDAVRLVDGHVLIWEEDDITYRLETDVSLEGAIRIAESLQ